MTAKELKELIANVPDETLIKINSILDSDTGELTPTSCTGFYHSLNEKVYLTPDIISI